MKKTALVAFLSAIAMLMGAPAAFAVPATVSQDYNLTVKARANVGALFCDNTGSTIEIGGTLESEAVKTDLELYQNVNKQKVITGFTTMKLTVFGEDEEGNPVDTIVVPKQPSRGGVGGNPWISFAFTDSQGVALERHEVLGRCVQGIQFRVFDADVELNSNVSTLVTGLECSQKATRLGLSKKNVTNNGINAEVLLDNNINKVVHQKQAAGKLSVEFLPSNLSQFTKKGANGTGGNPFINLQFYSGSEVSGWVKEGPLRELGRCKKLL